MIGIFCDFDGTIAVQDATDFVLERLAAPEWREVEAQWEAGLIDSAECMRRQISLIYASEAELGKILDQVKIDKGFADFRAFCRNSGIPIFVISDGVDYFIRHILRNHHLDDFPVFANQLLRLSNGRYQLIFPHRYSGCKLNAGICKCHVVDSQHTLRIYVGDGRSDFCVSHKPELVFAKDKLAIYCEQNDISFIRYRNFYDVTSHLKKILATSIHLQPETLHKQFARS